MVAALIVIASLLSVTVGFLIHIAIAAVILGCVIALVRYWIRKHQERTHPLRQNARAEKVADRTLKEIERTINKQ